MNYPRGIAARYNRKNMYGRFSNPPLRLTRGGLPRSMLRGTLSIKKEVLTWL